MSEHIYESPGYGEERECSESVPMIAAWQYREDDAPVDPSAHVSPDSVAVWVYPPYSSEGELEIVNESTRVDLDDRLAKENHILSRFKTDSYTSQFDDEFTAHILHAHEPVQPLGMDSTYTYRTTASDKLGALECHVCLGDRDTDAYYAYAAGMQWDAMCEVLHGEDLENCGMPLRLVAGLLCMLELRRIVRRNLATDAMTEEEAATVVRCVIIEHEMRSKKLGELDDDKWNFVKGIYAVRKGLELF